MEKPVFSSEFYAELAAENPLGIVLSWREAEAWFQFIAWPAYKTYGYRAHKRAVRRWWSRIRLEEIERARDAMENAKLEAAQQKQDQLSSERSDEISPDHRNALRLIMGGGGGNA